MSTPRATVSKLLPFSCVDGPGNRFVLFLQGCNFTCLTCHNPHTMRQCNDCGECIPACPQNALSLVEGRMAFDAAACDLCDACLKACPINANPMVQCLDVEEVLARLREDLQFLDGITVSGGEATNQLSFVTALFRAVKGTPELRALSCLIDSNGHLGGQGWRRVLPWTDGVMLDIKAMDPETHLALTGTRNTLVLNSARFLHREGKLQEIRFLVVPGWTDTEVEINALAAFLEGLDPQPPLRLNAFQKHGVLEPASSWPAASREMIERIAATLEQSGVQDVLRPPVFI